MGSTQVDTKYSVFRNRESVRDFPVMPSAVRLSTKTYWKLRGIIIIVNTRIPQTASSRYSASLVKIRTNTSGIALDARNITVVKQRHSMRTQKTVFRILSG